MAYGSVLTDVVQSSVTGTPPQFNDGAGTQVGTLCRVWVNFSGVSSTTIRASFNVSSVTYNSTGNYTVNFTNALTDANFATTAIGQNNSGTSLGTIPNVITRTTSSVRITYINVAEAFRDGLEQAVAVFR